MFNWNVSCLVVCRHVGLVEGRMRTVVFAYVYVFIKIPPTALYDVKQTHYQTAEITIRA